MSNIFYTISLRLILLFMFMWGNCAMPQDKQTGMKKTSMKLMELLVKSDSIQICSMFESEEDLANRREDIGDDCRDFISVTKKHGMPKIESLQLSKGLSDENVVSVDLLKQEDSLLNLKSCKLLVFFYPDKFLDKTNKILNYIIFTEPLKEKKQAIIPAPSLPRQKN